MDLNDEGLETVSDDTAEEAFDGDQGFDNLEDAVAALEDDTEEDAEQLTDEEEAEGEEVPEGESEEEDSDDPDGVLVTLENGEQIPLGMLKTGFMKDADYTRKTTEASEMRKSAEAATAKATEYNSELVHTANNIANFLQNLVPDEPPFAMAQSDPAGYQMQKAQREAIISQLEKAIAFRDDAISKSEAFTQDQILVHNAAEDAKLLNAMPHLKDPARRLAFDTANQKAAAEFGFSAEEIETVKDHRVLQLVHYARLGKQAEANRNRARAKPAPVRKGKAKAAPAKGAKPGQARAKAAFAKSGSLEDALKLDFD